MNHELSPRGPDAGLVPAGYAEKAMASLMQLHTELVDEKERRVELYRRLMEKEQTVAELKLTVKSLEEQLSLRTVRRAPRPPPPPPRAIALRTREPSANRGTPPVAAASEAMTQTAPPPAEPISQPVAARDPEPTLRAVPSTPLRSVPRPPPPPPPRAVGAPRPRRSAGEGWKSW